MSRRLRFKVCLFVAGVVGFTVSFPLPISGQPPGPMPFGAPVKQPPAVQPSKPPSPVLFTQFWLIPLVVYLVHAEKKKREEEEEEMTVHQQTGDASPVEYKILRGVGAVFKKPEKFRAALEEEARA